MRRQKSISVKVKAPSRGLVTSWPGEIADGLATGTDKFSAPGLRNRVSSVGSNVRYEEGVVRNAPGYDRVSVSVSILDGFLAHWRLDEVDGVRADSSLNHFDLTYDPGDSSISTVSGKFGPGALFHAIPLTTIEAPTSLSLSNVEDGSITLTWVDNSDNETGFRIERKLEAGAWEFVTNVAAELETYEDSGLLDFSLYTYRVRAFNATLASDWSNEASATTGEYLLYAYGDHFDSETVSDPAGTLSGGTGFVGDWIF